MPSPCTCTVLCGALAGAARRCYRCICPLGRGAVAGSHCCGEQRRHVALPVNDSMDAEESKDSPATSSIVVVFELRSTLDDECALCLEPMAGGQMVAAYRCAHRVHAQCARQWALYANSCPMCNT